MMIKAILFDLDGTLINTNNLIIETFQHVFKEYLNIDVKREELVRDFGEPLGYTIKRYTDDDKVDSLIKAYKTYNEVIHDDLTEAIDGVEEGIKELKEKGYKVAIVTSKRREVTNRGLKLFNLFKLMDCIVTPEDTEKHKPEPEPVLKACEILGVNPEETIMVGDSHNDILSGKRAGAKSCLVRYTAVPMDQVLKHEPDYIIDSILDIVDIVDKEQKEIS